jgi:hypothetical protein
MIQTIDAHWAFDWASHGSPDEAIKSGIAINSARQRPDYLPCKGRRIESVDFCDTAFTLNLDNGQLLRFGFVGNVVDVVVGEDVPGTILGPS